MALNKITAEEISEHSVVGMPEVPGLPAAEMQYRVEEVVREVAIPKINEVIDEFESVDDRMTALGQTANNAVATVQKDFKEFSEKVNAQTSEVKEQIGCFSAELENIPNTYATKKDVEEIIESNGQAVTSVFRRVGAIIGEKGDYTPQQVGAAPEIHKHSKNDITDFPESLPASDVYSWAKQSSKPAYSYSEVGAEQAGAVDSHNASPSAHSELFSVKQNKPTVISAIGAISVSLQDNCEYTYTEVSSITMNGTAGEAHGFVTFGSSVGAISISCDAEAGDDIKTASANETWEFSCFKNRFIWKNWG